MTWLSLISLNFFFSICFLFVSYLHVYSPGGYSSYSPSFSLVFSFFLFPCFLSSSLPLAMFVYSLSLVLPLLSLFLKNRIGLIFRYFFFKKKPFFICSSLFVSVFLFYLLCCFAPFFFNRALSNKINWFFFWQKNHLFHHSKNSFSEFLLYDVSNQSLSSFFVFFGCEIPFFPQKFWIFWTSQKIHHKNCFSNKKCWSRSHLQVNISCLEKYPFLQLVQIFFISCLCLSSFDKVSFDKIDSLKKTSFISFWFCSILSQEKTPSNFLYLCFSVFLLFLFCFSGVFHFFWVSKQKSFSKKKKTFGKFVGFEKLSFELFLLEWTYFDPCWKIDICSFFKNSPFKEKKLISRFTRVEDRVREWRPSWPLLRVVA